MAKNLPSIPAARKNDVPRCPLCGIVLDVTVAATGDNSGTLTITAMSLAHVSQPHTLTIEPKYGIRQRESGDWIVYRIDTGESSAKTPTMEVAEQLRDRWNGAGRITA